MSYYFFVDELFTFAADLIFRDITPDALLKVVMMRLLGSTTQRMCHLPM